MDNEIAYSNEVYPLMLSICIPTFNHEKYIGEALESVFRQNIEYDYEILVGEDKSTDKTKEILKGYENDVHKELSIFYREYNMNSSVYTNSRDLRDRAKGKYLIYLEGDDFWIDINKIHKQIEFLENNPDYIAVAHNCIIVDENSNFTNKKYKECKDEEYTFKHYASEIMPGQQATVLMRNFKYIDGIDLSFFNSRHQPGDRKMYFTLLNYGKVYCIQEPMSAYRYVEKGGSSWTANHKFNYQEWYEWYLSQLKYSLKLKNTEAIKYADFMLLLFIRQGLICNHSISLQEFFVELKELDNFGRSVILLIRRDFSKYILKRKVFF